MREGSNHTVYFNSLEKKVTTIPRHKEIDDFLVAKICKDLGIPKPASSHQQMALQDVFDLYAGRMALVEARIRALFENKVSGL